MKCGKSLQKREVVAVVGHNCHGLVTNAGPIFGWKDFEPLIVLDVPAIAANIPLGIVISFTKVGGLVLAVLSSHHLFGTFRASHVEVMIGFLSTYTLRPA